MQDHTCHDTRCCHCQKLVYFHEGKKPVKVGGKVHYVCRKCWADIYSWAAQPPAEKAAKEE